jgi:hypothetical protein
MASSDLHPAADACTRGGRAREEQYAQTFPRPRQQPVHTSLSVWSMAACSTGTKNQDRCPVKQRHLRACSRFRVSATHPESPTGEVKPPVPGFRGLGSVPPQTPAQMGCRAHPQSSSIRTLGLPPRQLCQDLLLIPSAGIPLANHASPYPALLFLFLPPSSPEDTQFSPFARNIWPRASSPVLWFTRFSGP